MRELTLEQIKVINDRLRAFDGGWVKTLDGFGGKPSTNYLDHQTITQILNYATYGITTWSFDIADQWREEIHKKDKQSQQWGFDGYVYHVKGVLNIDGLGSRTQFGKKVATGGASGQDMSYQSAASNALSKCATLFGIGEALYVPQNQIISQQFVYQETVNLLGHLQQTQQKQVLPSQPLNPIEQTQQEVENLFAPIPQQVQQQTMQQQQQQTMQQQQPQVNPTNMWASVEQNAFVSVENQLPTSFGAPQVEQQVQANWNQQQQAYIPEQMNINPNSSQPTQADIKFMVENEVPFGEAQAQPQMSQQQVPVQVQMPEQPTVMGPPVNVQQEPQQVGQEPIQVQGSDEQQKFMEQITFYNQHKARLGYKEDSEMLPYLRDFFKDENASTANLNMQTIIGFNEYMITIQV